MADSQRFLVFTTLLLCLGTSMAQEEDDSLVHHFLAVARAEGLISEDQLPPLLELANRVGGARSAAPEPSASEPSIFLKLYNQFTLLNVVHFSGALLIMGAYTLFMTIALEKFNHAGLSVIILIQTVAFGLVGVVFWENEEYRFVGGLFCTISTSTVPFLTYNLQRALNLWPREDPGIFQGFRLWIRPGWVVMEIATVVIGLLYLTVVRFPFLLFPVSFCLWFLSMDLAPFYPNFRNMGWSDSFEIRRKISLAFGIGMILVAYVFERNLGSDPDMGFWLYLFGTFTFWTSLHFASHQHYFRGSLYLLIQISLILMGSHLDRTTLRLFGTLGMITYLIGMVNARIEMSFSTILWLLKAASAAALFSQALRHGGNLEILAGLACAVVFNVNYAGFATSNEFYTLLLVVSNLGLVGVATAFDRPLSLWLFTLPSSTSGLILSLVCSVLVAIYHIKLPLKYLQHPPDSVSAYLYNGYRLIASVLIAFIFVSLRQSRFALVGGLGIPLIAMNFSPVLRNMISPTHTNRFNNYTGTRELVFNLLTFALLLLGVSFSTFLEANFLYLICCVSMFVVTMCHLDRWKVLGCVLSVLLILFSVPLQSSFLITIGAIYIFSYLSYLAYDYFRKSLLFPLVLITLGLVMIYCGIQYQKFDQILHDSFGSLLPRPLTALLTRTLTSTWGVGGACDWFGRLDQTKFSVSSFVSLPQNWILWSGALTFALTDGPPRYVNVACGVAIVVLLLLAVVLSYQESLVKDLDSSVTVSNIKFSLSQDPAHEKHGLVISVKGHKPRGLDQPVHLALNVDGSIWRVARSLFGDFAVSFVRSMVLPYKLTPHLISFTGFTKGSTEFSSKILLGTGHKGSQKMKHQTAQTTVEKLVSYMKEAEMTCVVVYSNSWCHPWSKLCVKTIKLKDIKEQIGERR